MDAKTRNFVKNSTLVTLKVLEDIVAKKSDDIVLRYSLNNTFLLSTLFMLISAVDEENKDVREKINMILRNGFNVADENVDIISKLRYCIYEFDDVDINEDGSIRIGCLSNKKVSLLALRAMINEIEKIV